MLTLVHAVALAVPSPDQGLKLIHSERRQDLKLSRSDVWGVSWKFICTGSAPPAQESWIDSMTAMEKYDAPFEWMRLPANTHLLIYGTSHMQALASALRAATKHLGILKSTDLISNSNPCGTSPVFDFEPPDEQVSASDPVCCGQTAKPCKLNSHSIMRDYLEGGSTITTVGNHAQSQVGAAATEHWLSRLTHEQGHNFTHAAFMVPHDPDWFRAQCAKDRGGPMPDPSKVGDRVEACGHMDPPDCPRKDPRYGAVAQFVTGHVTTVIRPLSDPLPNTLVREEARPVSNASWRRNPVSDEYDRLAAWSEGWRHAPADSNIYLTQALAPEYAMPEMAAPNCRYTVPQFTQIVDCAMHLCTARCFPLGADNTIQCFPGEGTVAAWLVLKATGLTR